MVEEILSKSKKRAVGVGIESDPDFSQPKYASRNRNGLPVEQNSENIGFGASHLEDRTHLR